MIHEVVLAAAARLRESFPDVPVYTEALEQGMETPCFSVDCKRPEMRRFFDKRWWVRIPLTLYCFPGAAAKKREIEEKLMTLFGAMDLIDCGGEELRGSNMRAEIGDGVGVFMVDYGFFAYEREAKEGDELMLNLHFDVGQASKIVNPSTDPGLKKQTMVEYDETMV